MAKYLNQENQLFPYSRSLNFSLRMRWLKLSLGASPLVKEALVRSFKNHFIRKF